MRTSLRPESSLREKLIALAAITRNARSSRARRGTRESRPEHDARCHGALMASGPRPNDGYAKASRGERRREDG